MTIVINFYQDRVKQEINKFKYKNLLKSVSKTDLSVKYENYCKKYKKMCNSFNKSIKLD